MRHVPADIVGNRPPWASPRGAMALLRQAARLVRREPDRLALLALWLIAGFFQLPLDIILFVVGGGSVWLYASVLAEPLAWLVIVPLMAAYTYTVMFLLWDRRPPVGCLWLWIDRPARYFHVLLAGSIPLVPGWLVSVVMRFLPAAFPDMRPDLYSPSGWALEVVLRFGLYLAFLPFAFAAISALAAREKFPKAIGYSLSLALRNWRLLVALLPAHLWLLLLQMGSTLHVPIMFLVALSIEYILPQGPAGFWILLALLLLLGSAVTGAILVCAQVVVALLYQEFVWRDREAAARAVTPESA